MPEGKVKWFNTRKGYGFISAPDSPDIFVHYSNISGDGYRTLVEGDTVDFDIVEGEKGLRAENVIPRQAATATTAAAATADAPVESEPAETEAQAKPAKKTRKTSQKKTAG